MTVCNPDAERLIPDKSVPPPDALRSTAQRVRLQGWALSCPSSLSPAHEHFGPPDQASFIRAILQGGGGLQPGGWV